MGEPASSAAETTVNVRVAIRCATIEAFVDKYWRLVDGDRIFIFSATPQAAGTRIRFNLVLSDGTELIKGEGRVIRSRQEASDPSRPPGMDVRFVPLDEPSRNLVEFLHATRMEQAARVLSRDEGVPLSGVDPPDAPLPDARPPPPPPLESRAPPPPPAPKTEPPVEKIAPGDPTDGKGPERLRVVDTPPSPQKADEIDKTPPPQKAIDVEKTPPPQKAIDVEKTPPPQKAIDVDRAATPQKAVDVDKTPPPQKAIDVDRATTPQKAIDVDKTPPLQKAVDVEKTPPLQKTVDVDQTPPLQKTVDVDKTPPQKVVDVDQTPPLQKTVDVDKTPPPGRASDGDLPRPSFAREARRTSAAELLASRWSAPALPAPAFSAPAATPAKDPPPPPPSVSTPGPAELSVVIEDADDEPPPPEPVAAKSVEVAPPPAPIAARPVEVARALPPPRRPTPPRMPSSPADLDRMINSTLDDMPPDAPDLPLLPAGEAVRFAEQWRPKAAPARELPSSTVPANPFANVNDEAIEFFVEWSLEQSKGEPTVDHARYADVPMTWGTPASEKRTGPLSVLAVPSARRWLPIALAAGGVVLGLGVGIPVGARLLAPKPPVEVVVSRPPPIVPAIAIDPVPPVAVPEPKPAAVAKKDPPGAPGVDDPPADPKPKLDGKSGLLTLTSLPPGARVTLDGVSIGNAPIERVVPAGLHKLAFDKERYNTTNRSISVAGGGSATVDVTMLRPVTRLAITSEPAGAKVTLNRAPVGKAPLELSRPAFEHYALHAELPGCKPIDRSLYLKPDDPPVALRCARR